MKQNPFPVLDAAGQITGWKWCDEYGEPCTRTFKTQQKAVRNLLSYMHWLDHGPTLWQRVWWPIRYTLWPKVVEFIRS